MILEFERVRSFNLNDERTCVARFRENPFVDLFRIRQSLRNVVEEKKNVTRAKRGKKFIYTDFNSTFVFIRDSSVSNEFHDTFRTFETFPYRDLRVYGTLNSRKNVYIYIFLLARTHHVSSPPPATSNLRLKKG